MASLTLDDNRLRLTLTLVIGGLASYTVYRSIKHVYQRDKVRRLKRQLAKDMTSFQVTYQPGVAPVKKVDPEEAAVREELLREQLARNYAFLGEEGMTKVRNAFVIVVGLGGVGSHAAHMLLRSGVQRLRLIDFDQVSLSSLNRHAVARRSDVGSPKALCLAKHFNEIFPDTIIEPIVRLFDLKAADTLLEGNPDYVLDCIDNLQTKIELIQYCKEHKLPIIASMGAGAKADPSHIQIADLSETFEDPLARSTRKGLKLKGIDGGVPVVYSTEKPGTVKLLPLEGEKVEEANEYGPLPNFRARILPVLGTLPALFGNAMASFVITELAGFATHPLRVKQRTKVYERILKDLKQEVLKKRQSVVNDAKKKGVEAPPEDENDEVMLTTRDVGYLLDEVYKGRSLLSGSVEKDKVTLVRWNPSLPQCPSNMVCMTRIEADRHVAAWQGGDAVKWLEERYEKEVLEKVKNRVNEVRQAEKWRG